MAFTVKMSGRAQRDIDRIIGWLAARSLNGAVRLEEAFTTTLDRIGEAPFSFGFATDDEFEQLEVREAFFRTRRGKAAQNPFHGERQ
jgi:plasmid stabilization system protein ParE